MAGAIEAVGGPIVRKDAAERIVTAPVLIPDEPDRERHQYRAENIEHLAKSFIASGEIDAMHAGGEVGYPTENYIAPQELQFDDRTIPAGAWMLSTKITDDEVWQGVTDGTYQGLSVFGPIRRVLDADGNELDLEEISQPVGGPAGAAVANSFSSTGIQRELPAAPVGTHWTVELEQANFVSIVDDPAVQAASFVVAKSATGGSTQEQPVMDQEFEERFDKIETAVEKSADAAEAAQESAEEAQTAAEEAVEDGGDGSGDGSGDGGSDDDLADTLNERFDSLEERIDDIEDGDGDGSGDPDFDVDDLDDDTLETLVDQGVLDEGALDEIGGDGDDDGDSALEKRVAALEKSNGQNGRSGSATQLDGIGDDGDGPSVGNSGVAAGLRGEVETDEGGDDE